MAAFLSGPGWTIPDHGLSRFPPVRWDHIFNVGTRALEVGASDREAWWATFDDPATVFACATIRAGRDWGSATARQRAQRSLFDLVDEPA